MKTELVEKVSKTGTKYVCLEIELVPGYKKTIFLDKAEEQLIKIYYSNNK